MANKLEVTLFRETATTRKATFRIDSVGVYLLFWQRGQLAAGVTFQWPSFIQHRVNGEFAGKHYAPGLTMFSWDEELLDNAHYLERFDYVH